ncbi:MAG: zinc-binding dehydrogenase [Pseudomonadota bacterium]
MARHEIKPVIDKVYLFAEHRDGYQRLASGNHVGKIVIDVVH